MAVILCGGGCGEQTVISNQLFETLIDPDKPMLYIPLAMKPERYDGCLTWVTGEFQNVKHGDIVMVRSADEIIKLNLFDYSAVFIGGGNTYRLLKQLKDSGAFDRIKTYLDNGGIVYGGSAGAIIFGKDIDSCLYMDENEVDLQDTTGFNSIFDFSLTAHYTNKNEVKTETATEYLNQYSKTKPVIALPEEDSLYTDGNIVKIIGTRPYYIFNQGKKQKFEPGVEYTRDEFINIVKNI